jgi:hypothetical protein
LPGRVSRVQGPNKDQAGLRRGLHACTIGVQIGVLAAVQGGQGGKQAHLLVRNRTLCRWHSDLPALPFLGARGLKRPMRGIMEHARGWCK